ncbi:hypothetical protein VaNZ11_013268 [Volvox africanus]|uniref:tRNA (guanine(26)-N(2))-dimethyltransferase n=1 Tax=Volvox africanus TaxID=51714 RepID=A0ABQ5SFQ9_9CHLO|nr:hypothetical protein VaNZ11_013268 [Volvox africanus]
MVATIPCVGSRYLQVRGSIPRRKMQLQWTSAHNLNIRVKSCAFTSIPRAVPSTTGSETADAAVIDGAWKVRGERGVSFITGEAFYRAESCAGRDLAVLAAVLHRRRTGSLRVLDVMGGSGMRGARYLAQADADEVWVNEGNMDLHYAVVYNMCSAAGLPVPRVQAGCATAAITGPAGVASDSTAGLGPANQAATATEREELSGQSLRAIAAYWEGQAQRLRLEGLARDVWQWDVPRPTGSCDDALRPRQLLTPAVAEAAADSKSTACSLRDGNSGDSGSSSYSSLPRASGSGTSGLSQAQSAEPTRGHRRIRISHADANRLLTNCYMRESYYDVVDVDSFGSGTMHFPAAIDAVRYGGLIYLTGTDGFTTSGKRPARSLAAYGSYARATPWANEQGLRMIIGSAVREAAARGVTLAPIFSLYSYHGPVFRVMLRATRSAEWPANHYGFMGHCFVHGDNYTVGWRQLGKATCRCAARGRRPIQSSSNTVSGIEAANNTGVTSNGTDLGGNDAPSSACISASSPGGIHSHTRRGEHGSGSSKAGSPGNRERTEDTCEPGAEDGSPTGIQLVLSGPLWTGPLHDAAELQAMAAEAASRGWTGFGLDAAATPHLQNRVKSSRNVRPLEELLEVLLEEADPRLPPGFFSIDESVARRLVRPPSRDGLIAALRQEGFAAARCHLEARAFRTNACMVDVLRVAEERLGIPRRR